MSTPIVEQVAETTLRDFESKLRDKPLVILYPRHRGRNALVALLLQQYNQDIVYYTLSEDDTTLQTWLKHIIGDIFPQGFDSQTLNAISSRAHPDELAVAFAADLGSLRSERYVLLLDAFDRLGSTGPMDPFIRSLPDVMPGNVQIVISARLMDLQPWNDLINEGQAAVVGNEEALGGGIYGEEGGRGQLEVFALSGGHVYIDGQPVTSWDGSLPRHLFYYFVDHPMVTRDEIFSIFWPNMSVKEATNVFHVTKRKISERLGYELTNYSGGFYVHSPRLSVHYDVRTFEESVQDAIINEGSASANWYQAVQLYRADYLPGVETSWAEARRAELKHKYAQALIGLGRYHRGLGELDQALGYLLRALREKPDWEDVHRDVMLIYYQQGRRDEAASQYQQLTRTLQQAFGIQPSRDTRNLYEVITAV
ncbi:MAG TPA: bacterial transcriptional activator domain-containing protein [Aggregatilinea sp.]|jgi:DNA-binding SARP family transcriptional activator|uniref:bacterial transcriptional activator domain-containing protein n=1 Tax=Aggregatilinea sp. TaxID=2806333 RepID=UPI002BFA4564|nr:bacterial transcriptional activator domain-containing protein [Aggregatilinea sp.]HML21327.1 bacterial transcriptional activator domain-containing protein [Aggregatilinea sp.]